MFGTYFFCVRIIVINGLSEFRRIARQLNADLNIVPLLYGSLGLQLLVPENLYPDDIDILVPQEYIDSGWKRLMTSMESIGYRLVDLHEHEFKNDKHKVAFSFIEDLSTYVQIEISEIQTREEDGVFYKLLNLHQYLKVYEKSSSDSYRANKNNDKDRLKIEVIKRNSGSKSTSLPFG